MASSRRPAVETTPLPTHFHKVRLMPYDSNEHADPTFSDLLWSRVAYSQFNAGDRLMRWGVRRHTADRLVSGWLVTIVMAILTLVSAAVMSVWIVVALAGRAVVRAMHIK